MSTRYYSPNLGRFINADALAATSQGILGNNMFAYCNNNPVNAVDSSGRLPVRNTMLMTSDSGVNIQYRAYKNEKALQKRTRHEKYFLEPAIITSFPIEIGADKGIDLSGSVALSLSHGEINPEGIVSITTDMGLFEAGINVGSHGLALEGGIYLEKTSIAIKTPFPFTLEISPSIGFSRTAKFTPDKFEIGFSDIIGCSVAIVWDDSSEVVYWPELFDQ